MMTPEQIKFARHLETQDTKTLSQKLTKTVSELGDLAAVILPYENAAGAIKTFVVKNQILEEVIDVILCAQSIAHHLGYTDQQIQDMFQKKLTKWDGLQANEKVLDGKDIPFEINISVKISDEHIPNFRKACEKLQVKPIILDLQNITTGHIQDVMTSSTHFGTNISALEYMTQIADALNAYGFVVVREKIETVPWHPAAPQKHEDVMKRGCYFESHLAVICNVTTHDALSEISQKHKAHLSRNKFKSIDKDNYIMMVTYRDYDSCREVFEKTVSVLSEDLSANNFQVEKTIVEFAIYDTNIDHDASWLMSSN